MRNAFQRVRMHNTSDLSVSISPYNTRHGDVFIADPIEKCRVWKPVYNAHTTLLHRTTFFYMKSISAGTVFILFSLLDSLRHFSNFLRSSFRILSAELTTVIVATTDARINIVLLHATFPLWRWFSTKKRESSLRQVKLEKVEMRKSKTAYSFPAGNIPICFHLVS